MMMIILIKRKNIKIGKYENWIDRFKVKNKYLNKKFIKLQKLRNILKLKINQFWIEIGLSTKNMNFFSIKNKKDLQETNNYFLPNIKKSVKFKPKNNFN